MSAYINTETLEYPLFIGDIQLIYPDATADNVPLPFKAVICSDVPEVDEATEIYYELAPILDEGSWKQVFFSRKYNEIELAAIAEVLEFQKTRNPSTSNLNVSGSEPNVVG